MDVVHKTACGTTYRSFRHQPRHISIGAVLDGGASGFVRRGHGYVTRIQGPRNLNDPQDQDKKEQDRAYSRDKSRSFFGVTQQPMLPHTVDNAEETIATSLSRATPHIETTNADVINKTKTQPGTSPSSPAKRCKESCRYSITSSFQGTNRSKVTNPGHSANLDVIGNNPDLLLPGQVLVIPSECE